MSLTILLQLLLAVAGLYTMYINGSKVGENSIQLKNCKCRKISLGSVNCFRNGRVESLSFVTYI